MSLFARKLRADLRETEKGERENGRGQTEKYGERERDREMEGYNTSVLSKQPDNSLMKSLYSP